jgi:hypothetical protein
MRQTMHQSRQCALAAVVLAAGSAGVAQGQAKNWNVEDGNWNVAANWSPLGVPGPANSVFVGNTAAAANGWLHLNVNVTVAALTITDGMAVDTETSQLTVAGATVISGYNSDGIFGYPSRLVVADGPALTDVVLGSLVVADEGWLDLSGGGVLVSGLFDIDDTGSAFGDGLIRLTSDAATAMRVDGNLGAGMPLLTILQEGAGRIDLDGAVQGDETINITLAMGDGSDFARLRIVGEGLVDAMDDHIWIGGGNELTMDLVEGWSMGPGAELTFFGSFDSPPAYLKGSHVTFHGAIEVSGNTAEAWVQAPVTFAPTASVSIGGDDSLVCKNDTTIEGGSFTLALGANLFLDGDTLVQGGTFASASAEIADGAVRFDGTTVYDGTITIDGAAQQNGDVSVVGPTVITADRLDLDGFDGLTTWSIGNSLVANLGAIDSIGNYFDGSIEIEGTFLGKLTLNLPVPDEFWVMNGSMSLGGVAAIMTTRLDGNPILVGGELSVANRVRADCQMRFGTGSTVTFAGPASRLRSTEYADVFEGASFSGGQFENAPGATLMLFQGASLGSTHLSTDGDLVLGSTGGTVIAFVSSMTMTATSRWFVDIGGAAPGADHDQLQASGNVVLAGALEIDLLDLGNGVFEPTLGSTYTIMKAPLGARSGAFSNQPVTFVPGKAYLWAVGYGTTRGNDVVTVKVTEIIPCPADLNGDGQVDGADLAIMLGAWGPCVDCNADLDLSGMVDGADLAVLLGAWGGCV